MQHLYSICKEFRRGNRGNLKFQKFNFSFNFLQGFKDSSLIAVATMAMALDIGTIMSEHGLSKEEATEVLRQLKEGPSTPALQLGFYVFFGVVFCVATFEI